MNQIVERKTRWAEELTEKIVEWLEKHPCVDCGFSDPRALEFDHRNPETKILEVSQAPRHGWSWVKTLQEIKKCDVRCANCHRIKTGTPWLRAKVVHRRAIQKKGL